MKAYGSIAVGGDPGAHVPLTTAPYGVEYERMVARNVAANEGVRRLKRAVTDAIEGKGTRAKDTRKKPPKKDPKIAPRQVTAAPLPRHKLTDAQARKASEAYAAGARVVDLARQFGCGPEAVRTAIRRAGGPIRRGGRPQITDPAQVKQIVRDYLAGASALEIGQAHGLGQKAVARVIHDAGVMRSRAEAAAALRSRKL